MGANNREIERKYLLRALPEGVAQYPSAVLDQGYIPGTQVRERVRRIREDGSDAVQYLRTIKVGTGIERFEFEEDTTDVFFTTVWPLTEGRRIRKRRYRVPSDGSVWEIDEFLDRDLVLAEVELTSADQHVEPTPEIAAVMVREVTNEPGFTNYKLSR